jgi:hypothetical protein
MTVEEGKKTIERAVDVLRTYIKDIPEMNKLLGNKYENDPKTLELCIWMALDDWNVTPPPLPPVKLENHPAKSLLIQYAALLCLRSAGIWHSRERMPSSDGGTSADDHAKFAEYQGWIGNMFNEYQANKNNVKKSINLQNAFGGFSSEYYTSAYTTNYIF